MTVGELKVVLQGMLARAADPKPALVAIGPLFVSSVVKTFRAEGRPDRWTPVKPATAKRKAKAGKTKILTWSGALQRSVQFQVQGQVLKIGSNLPYARIHNEGGTIQREGGLGRIRLRTDVRGELLRQNQVGQGPHRRGSERLAVFASGSHRRAVERIFFHGEYSIPIPARPFLVIQPEDRVLAGAILRNWVLEGRASA